MPSIFFQLRLAAARFYYSCGGFGLHQAQMMVSQEMTKKPLSPVRIYTSLTEMKDHVSRLKWTEDPWGGKLDILKHPTFMQEALDQHPEFSGDCDDYAGYFIVAIRKGKLAESAHFGFALWEDKGDITGHMVCVFLKEGSWWWVSNWYNCQPQAIPSVYGWVDAMQEKMGKKVLIAGRILVEGIKPDDTIEIGSLLRCR